MGYSFWQDDDEEWDEEEPELDAELDNELGEWHWPEEEDEDA